MLPAHGDQQAWLAAIAVRCALTFCSISVTCVVVVSSDYSNAWREADYLSNPMVFSFDIRRYCSLQAVQAQLEPLVTCFFLDNVVVGSVLSFAQVDHLQRVWSVLVSDVWLYRYTDGKFEIERKTLSWSHSLRSLRKHLME